jgi:hypothetical protein
MYNALSYAIYLAVSLALTLWVSRTLNRSGRSLPADALPGNSEPALTKLPLLGFYLVNIGFITLLMTTARTLANTREAVELAADKIGGVVLVLGITHFVVLSFFHRLRRRGQERSPHARTYPGWTAEGAPLGKVLD